MTELILKNTGKKLTNFLLHSEELDNAYWDKTNLNTTGTPPWVDVEIAPDGTQTAEKLIGDTQNGLHNVRRLITDSNAYRVFSAFVKADEINEVRVRIQGGTGFANRAAVRFDLNTKQINVGETNAFGTFTQFDYKIDELPNGWFRIQVGTFIPPTESSCLVLAELFNVGANFTGNDVDGLYVWGLQLSEDFSPYLKTTSVIKSTVVGTKVIEIDEKYGISTEGCIADIRDLERTSGASSKTLFITSNDEVNQTLGSIFNINIDDSLSFDLQVKQECQLWHNGELIMDGFFQIVNIDYVDKFHYLYEIVVFDEQINLFLEIEENLIVGNPDQSKDLDFSQYDHQFLLSEVTDSWAKGPYQIPYTYMLFDTERDYWIDVNDYKPAFYVESIYREIFAKYGYAIESDFFKEQLFKDLVIPFSTGDDVPTISVIEAENRTAQAITDGCSVVVADENNPALKRQMTIIDRFPTYLPYRTSSPTSTFYNDSICYPSNQTGITYGDLPGLIPDFTNNYDIEFQFDFSLDIDNTNTTNPAIPIINTGTFQDGFLHVTVSLVRVVDTSLTVNSTLGIQDSLTNANNDVVSTKTIRINQNYQTILAGGSQSFNGTVGTIFENVQLIQGQLYYLRVNPEPMGYLSPGVPLGTAALGKWEFGGSSDDFVRYVALQNEIIEGDDIRLNQWLPQNMKQKDFIKSINKMFNLKMAPLKGQEKTILVEPKDDFYKKGIQIDLNNNDQFYIIDSQSKYNVLTDFQTREVLLTYDEDNSDNTDERGKFLLKDYQDTFKENYGQQRILFDNENVRNKTEIKVDFAPTMIVRQNAHTEQRRYLTGAISAINPKNKPRILFKNVLPNTAPYVEDNGRPTRSFFNPTSGNVGPDGIPFDFQYLGNYCTGTHFMTDPFKPEFDLNFGRVRSLFYTPEFLTDNNLFQDFWLNTVRQFNEQKMITVKAYISNTQYNQLDWNTKLYADLNEYNGWFIINKIKEYNVKTGEAILELITYDLDLEFDLRRPIRVPITDLPSDTFAPAPIIDKISYGENKGQRPGTVIIGNDNNNVGEGNIIVGNFNRTSGRNNLILGNDNIIPSDIKNAVVIGDDVDPNDVLSDGITTKNLSVTNNVVFGPNVNVSGLTLEGTQYILVNAEGTDIENAQTLQDAYDLAKTMSPSASNRITVIATPGNYHFGSSDFKMDTQFIDLVSLDGNRSIIFNAPFQILVPETGTIDVQEDNIFIKGVDVQTKPFKIETNLPNLKVENCIGGDFSFNNVEINGTFINCEGGNNSFGSSGTGGTVTVSGTFDKCIGGNGSFGASGSGGDVIVSGTFDNCTSGFRSFGSSAGDVDVSGEFNNCTSGFRSFGSSDGTAAVDVSGEFNNCTSGFRSFGSSAGGVATVSGTFTNCTGGDISFGASFSGTATLDGKLYYCRLIAGTFNTTNGTGKIRYCVDGNDDIITTLDL